MIFYLLIVFLLTLSMIDCSGQEKKDGKLINLKLINEKICTDKPDKNLAEKMATCENLIKTAVNMNIEFKIDQFYHLSFYFYQKSYEIIRKCIESQKKKVKFVLCYVEDEKVIINR